MLGSPRPVHHPVHREVSRLHVKPLGCRLPTQLTSCRQPKPAASCNELPPVRTSGEQRCSSPAALLMSQLHLPLVHTTRWQLNLQEQAERLSLSLLHRSRQLTVLRRSAGQVGRLMVSSWSAKQRETKVWHALLSVQANGTLMCKLRRCSCGLALWF